MRVTVIVLTAVLALVFLGSGGTKLVGNRQSGQRDHLRIDQRLWSLVGVLEVAAGVGLLVGLIVPALGVAAAIGLALLMVAAIAAHVRVGDLGRAVPAAVVMLVAVAAGTLTIASL